MQRNIYLKSHTVSLRELYGFFLYNRVDRWYTDRCIHDNGGTKAPPYNAAAGFGVGQGLAPAARE